MTLVIRIRGGLFAAAASALLVSFAPAYGQDISETHLKAAYAAVDAINATDVYDQILPEVALALKRELIQKDPNLQPLISATVDEKTLELASRRGDLEHEAALAYAKVFSEEELKQMSDFYNSEVGQKLISDGPIVTREVAQAAQIWQRGIARDLAQAVGEHLQAVTSQQTQTTEDKPAENQ
jgi:hypothetical protein